MTPSKQKKLGKVDANSFNRVAFDICN